MTIDLLTLKRNKSDLERKKISSSQSLYDYVKQFYDDDIDVYESFWILLLNINYETIGYAKISQGGVTSCVVDVKIIAKYVVDSLASAVILVHNHPSGNLKASEQDINITKKVSVAIKNFDCQLLDHIIVGGNGGYLSFADEGLL